MALRIVEGIVTRNTDEEAGTGLRGAVFFQSDQLLEDQEYPIPAQPLFPPDYFSVPDVDDLIEIEIDTDLEMPEPRWRAVIYNVEDEVPEDFQTNYPKRKGVKTKAGNMLLFDDTADQERVQLQSKKGKFIIMDDVKDGTLTIFHDAGALIQIDNAGSIKMIAKDGSLVFVDADDNAVKLVSGAGASATVKDGINLIDSSGKNMVSITADGNVNVFSEQNVNISGGVITLEGGSINVGSPALFKAVLAETLKIIFDAHLHLTPVGTSGPPLPPNTMAVADATPATAVSADFVKLKGNTP